MSEFENSSNKTAHSSSCEESDGRSDIVVLSNRMMLLLSESELICAL